MYFPPKPKRAWANTSLHQKLIEDPNWIVEPKYNGDRCLVIYTSDGPQLWSRHGKQHRYTWLDPLKEELARWDLPDGCILDAELCVEPKPRQELYVFDIPTAGGKLSERRKVLEELFEDESFEYIFLTPRLEKSIAYDQAMENEWEGVVWKRLDSNYEWQRAPESSVVIDWLKMKPVDGYK